MFLLLLVLLLLLAVAGAGVGVGSVATDTAIAIAIAIAIAMSIAIGTVYIHACMHTYQHTCFLTYIHWHPTWARVALPEPDISGQPNQQPHELGRQPGRASELLSAPWYASGLRVLNVQACSPSYYHSFLRMYPLQYSLLRGEHPKFRVSG